MPTRPTPGDLSTLPAMDDDYTTVVVETPKGQRTKVAYDPARRAFVVKKVLPEGMSFPLDFGFVPSTRGEDGDPLDVLLFLDEPVASGTVVPARLLGVISAEQTERDGTREENDRLVAVAGASELYKDVKKLSDLPDVVVHQIETFFQSYNAQEGKTFALTGTHGRKRAQACVERGRRAFRRG